MKKRKILVLLDSEISRNTNFRKPIRALKAAVNNPRQIFNRNYARREAANNLLKEVAELQGLKGRRTSIETHNKLVGNLIHSIHTVQGRLFTAAHIMTAQENLVIINTARMLDKCLLLDPLLREVEETPQMELLEEKIKAAFEIAKTSFDKDPVETWYIFNDIVSEVYNWRTKAEKLRMSAIIRIEADLISYKQAVRRLNKKKTAKKIAA